MSAEKLALRRIRRSLALTQGELFNLSGISVSMISAVEKGTRALSKEKVIHLRAALSLTEKEFDILSQEKLSDFKKKYGDLKKTTQSGILEIFFQQIEAREKLKLK